MAVVREPDALLELLHIEAVGKVVSSLQVYGINNLKSFLPPLEALAGERVSGATMDPSSHLILQIDSYRLHVNLERTGGIVVHDTVEPWRPGSVGPQPTARLLLQGGRAIDFREPGRTKRITFRLTGPEVVRDAT